MSPDLLSKAAEQLKQLQQLGFTGTVTIKLEMYEGGVRACHFGTDQQIHPEVKPKNKKN